MEQQIELSVPQAQFVNMEVPYPLFCGAMGSGKSWAGCAKLCKSAWTHPKVPLGFFAPSYGDIRHTFFPTMTECAEQWGLNVIIRKADFELDLYEGRKYRTTIICRSLSNPEAIRGFKIGRGMVDEIDTMNMDTARDSWLKAIARRRFQFNGTAWLGVTTTPEGYAFAYNTWVKAVREDVSNGNKLGLADKYQRVTATTFDNIQYLQPGYIEDLMASYPINLVRAYVYGQFTNLTQGSVYREFDRVKNSSTETIQKDEPIFIGLDFNVNKMAASVFVKRDGIPHAVAEIVDALDTPDVIRIIKERYWDYEDGREVKKHNIRIYPDSSGGARHTTNASTSDLQLLSSSGFTVVANKANPRIKDRINAVNAAICNSNGERKFFVNINACPTLADNLEQQTWDKNGKPDKQSGMDHILDSCGYFMNMDYPINKPATKLNIRWAI
jgi:hypothetical protein